MKIDKLLDFIKKDFRLFITRGEIIDFIANNNDKWILALKALLIKKHDKFINRHYLLQKLFYMQNNPLYPESFLDLDGTIIYNVLIGE